jgi:hypothetical protein
MDTENDGAAACPPDDRRGHFFAVDRRAWARVCGLGMNPAVAYLVQARGTGGDNRTTKWSTNSIEQHTGIGRSRAAAAIAELERGGLVVRLAESTPSRPKYKIAPAHRVPGCEGCPPPLNDEQQGVLDRLGDGWTAVPSMLPSLRKAEREGWGVRWPLQVAFDLVRLGRVEPSPDSTRFRAVLFDIDKPDWIWLPNALVDGAAGETPPVELVRQTGCAWTLRLLVDLYGAQGLDEDGGIHFRAIRQDYARHRIGEQGPYVVWGFSPGTTKAWPTTPFAAPHLPAAGESEETRSAAWKEFWVRWHRLRDLGLVELVAHVVHADMDEGEILHPVALPGTGLEVEQELGEAARRAGAAMVTRKQLDFAVANGVKILVPVPRHIAEVQTVGIARLRYRPRTRRTLAFIGHGERWRRKIADFEGLAGAAERSVGRAQAGSAHLQHQGQSKVRVWRVPVGLRTNAKPGRPAGALRSRQGSEVLVRAPRFL